MKSTSENPLTSWILLKFGEDFEFDEKVPKIKFFVNWAYSFQGTGF